VLFGEIAIEVDAVTFFASETFEAVEVIETDPLEELIVAFVAVDI
jgi:hypothetical protein